MRNRLVERAIQMAMIAGAVLMLPACGSHDGASNDAGNHGGSAGNSGGGGGGSSDSSGSGANGTDLGENDMDSNVAQVDAANSTTVAGPKGTTGNGPR